MVLVERRVRRLRLHPPHSLGWLTTSLTRSLPTHTSRGPRSLQKLGATVVFFERNFVYYEERRQAVTDAQGAYRFTGMNTHIGQLEACTGDGRKSERRQLRLWFRAQDSVVPPLVVGAGQG